MKKNTIGFTLVELIVVATILAILATVGFISYENYLVDTRDSKRLSQLAGLRDGMRLGITKGKLPLPDDAVEIRNSGTAFLHQGYAGENVLESIGYASEVLDPYDEVPYTYLVSRNRRDFQLLGFLEKYNKDVILSSVNQGFANVDYSQRFPNVFGKKLGILLEQETNTPLQEMNEYSSSGYIDLQNTTTNTFDAYVTDSYLISGKEDDLIGIIPYTTCKKILESGGTYGNGIYNINPSGLNPFEVYCDMETDGGGWTLVGRSVENSTATNFGWLQKTGNIRDDENVYSLGSETQSLVFNEMMVTTYTQNKNIETAVKFGVNDDFLKHQWYAGRANSCTVIFNESPISPYNDPCTVYRPAFGWYGHAGMTSNFFFWRHDNPEGPQSPPFAYSSDPNIPRYGHLGLTVEGFKGGQRRTSEIMGHYEGQQGMIFVR